MAKGVSSNLLLVTSETACTILQMMLAAVGATVRHHRDALGWSRRRLADASGVSERFLAQLEAGDGNISLRRFADVARALGTTASALLASAETGRGVRPIALLGMRGAGKSTVGAALAKRRGARLVELDREIAAEAGLPLAQLFELHGEAYYHRVERDVLARVLGDGDGELVIATGGSIVTDADSFALLRARCTTVWLRARAEDHWSRVVAQGDRRPMANSPHAFDELRALLAARAPLYARADHVVDTSRRSVARVVSAVATQVAA
jgi:XRE family aerobic/anaerobic benzoate catabolism transcriptional regulator